MGGVENHSSLAKLAAQSVKSSLLNFTATESNIENRSSAKRLQLFHQSPDYKLHESAASSTLQQQPFTDGNLLECISTAQNSSKLAKKNSSNNNSNTCGVEVVLRFKP